MGAGYGRRFGDRLIRILAGAVLPGLVASLAVTPEAGGESGPSKEALLNRISKAVSHIERISCRFVQERRTALLEHPLLSSGRFDYLAPDCLRWEVTHPESYGFSVCHARAVRWKGRGGQSRDFSLDAEPGLKQFTDQVFAWIHADFHWLEMRYRIGIAKTSPVTLNLSPLSKTDPGGITRMLISFSPELSHVETVDIQETDGDSTRIRFSDAVINGPANEALFR